MINKALRIMIADLQHFRRLRLERYFNYQGYYAIAPVSSLDEMLTLLGCGDRIFDLVIVNSHLAPLSSFSLSEYFRGHELVREAVIYETSKSLTVKASNEINELTASNFAYISKDIISNKFSEQTDVTNLCFLKKHSKLF